MLKEGPALLKMGRQRRKRPRYEPWTFQIWENRMPGADGKLTDEERENIRSQIQGKMQTPACPVCGSSQWTLSDMIVTPTTLGAGGGFTTGDRVFPQLMLISECGYTRYFSAAALGLAF